MYNRFFLNANFFQHFLLTLIVYRTFLLHLSFLNFLPLSCLNPQANPLNYITLHHVLYKMYYAICIIENY